MNILPTHPLTLVFDMHSETDLEVRLSELARAREPKPLGADADWLDLDANPATVYVVQALTHGSADAQVVFLSAAEACAFRDECSAFEATRYTEDAAEEAGVKGYMTLREEFDQRHPWRRFSRGVRFVARSQAVGRPVKAPEQTV